ncbi:J domain-containing protein [Cupriavidus sp. WS]|uniref:J domain-containing protein n=1 Tax=Cupriavidus sp. WS TaxID=1312922 RepID=UPI0009DC41C8|nr:J domain-containing protein [Cupriavidus sp. WS]
MTENYYGVLGVREDASAAEIKSAYRYSAAKGHPGHGENSSSDDIRRFAQLAEAYAVLSDEAARAAYDIRRHPAGAHSFTASQAAVVDPEATFVGSMVDWSVELRLQGYSGDRIRDLFLSHHCPGNIADAVTAMFGGTVARAVPTPTRTPTRKAPPSTPLGVAGYTAGKVVGALTRRSNGIPQLLGILAVLAGVLYLVPKESSEQKAPSASHSTASSVSPKSEIANTPEPDSPSSPYAFLSKVPEIRSLDTTHGVGQRSKESFHLPAGITLPESEYGFFHTSVAARIPLPFGTRVLYLMQSIPAQSQSFDCHACAPVVSAIITAPSKSGVETPATSLQDLGLMGAWGKYDTSFIALVEVGRKTPGLVFRQDWMGQGEAGSSVAIFSIGQKGIRRMTELTTGGSNTGSMRCAADKSACENYDVSLRFMRDNKSQYYPLEVKVSGTKINESGVAVPVSETFISRYNGKNYVRNEEPVTAAPASEAASPTAGAQGGQS